MAELAVARAGSEGRKTWLRKDVLSEKILKSTVFLCTNVEDGQKFVAKTVDAQDLEPRTGIEIERRMYKNYKPIDSPYFPKYLGFNIEPSCKEMSNIEVCNLFLEWVHGGSLKLYIRSQKHALEEKVIAAFCRDILKGLAYLHAQGKVHGDIKCSNILVGPKNLKICDLGKGKILADGEVYLPPMMGQDPLRKRIYTTGSEGFRAPEVIDEIAQGPEADIYALGCTLVEMATGFPPQKIPRIFFSGNKKDRDPETGIHKSSLHIPTSFSPECFDFLDACLAQHPNGRPPAQTLLNHPWFRKFPIVYSVQSGTS